MNQFSNFLNEISTSSLNVLDVSIPITKYIPIDLSPKNELLKKINVSSSSSLETYVNTHIEKQHGLVAYGGYNEVRDIYKRSSHFNSSNSHLERNIHLGIDLWLEAESSVFTPLDATIHSFKNNQTFGDYGPTIILRHKIQNEIFYTLYGHLSLQSILGLKVGQKFYKGECIAKLGDASVNGDYPPHLHFQIINVIQNYQGDYPGVCCKKDLDFYLNNCPDPNTLLKLEI
jgi:murein DD-endopeptidase MepM/ murein hydrolase activator NlpD